MTKKTQEAATRKQAKRRAKAQAAIAEPLIEKAEPKTKRSPGNPRVDEAPAREFGNSLPQIAAVLKSHEARLEGELAKIKAAQAALGE